MKILLVTTMYPGPLRPVTTDICHSFAKEWVKMGHEVFVIHYRSLFPAIYTTVAKLLPGLAKRYVGNHVEMDREKRVVEYEKDNIPVSSIPIFKYFPHGRYSKKEIKKQVTTLLGILKKKNYKPDAIIGHFHNPQFEIIGALKKEYPDAHTCVSLHELYASVLEKCYGKDCEEVINGVDMIGFRSVPIKKRFEEQFGTQKKSFVCWSGTPPAYLKTSAISEDRFNDGPIKDFIYVGQTIKRKYPKETIEALHTVYGNSGFHLTYVGSKDIAYPETQKYIDENGIQACATFVGQIPRNEIMELYDKSQCFVMISKYEVFGLVYLEAMARGCITIASRDEGMEGIIEDGVNGFLCEAGDTKELSDIIRRINKLTQSEKEKMSKEARKTAEKLSDYNVAKRYIDAVMSA